MESDRSLRVLMVAARFAPYVGGTEIHTAEVASALVRRGHEVTVVTTDTTGELSEHETMDGVEVIRLKAYPSFSDLYFTPKLKAFIASQPWDVIHLQGYHTAVAPLALSAALDTSAVVVMTFHSGGHSSRLRNLIRPIQARLLNPLLQRVDLLIGVSRFETELFRERLGLDADRFRVIPNGSAPETTDEPSTAGTIDSGLTDPDSDDVVLLSMGRLERYKGHHLIIGAMSQIIEKVPNARLLILGKGPYEDTLRKQTKRLGLEDRVTFSYIPSEERPRLHAVLRDTSLAVLLSDYESHGMAAHEAVAAGLPLVVTDESALSELVEAGAARSVQADATAEQIAAVVVETLDNPPDMAAVSDLDTFETYDWTTVADRVEAEYRRLIERDGSV